MECFVECGGVVCVVDGEDDVVWVVVVVFVKFF